MMSILNLIRYKNLLIIAFFQALLRYGLILPILHSYGIEPALSNLHFALVVISTVLLAAAGNVINDYFDVRIDSINRPQRVIIGKYIERRSALLLHVILTLGGVFVGLYVSFVYRRESYALMFICVPFLLWFYSTYFKKQMLTGNLVVALLVALVAYLVVSVEFSALERKIGSQILASQACSLAWLYTTGFAAFAFLSNLIREIIKDMEDAEGDKAAGCHTLPIEMGMTNSKILVTLLLAFMIFMLWISYAMFHWLRDIPYVLPYFAIFLTLPSIVVGAMVWRGNDSKTFHNASQASKVIMLAGILFTLVLGTNV